MKYFTRQIEKNLKRKYANNGEKLEHVATEESANLHMENLN